MAAEPGWVVEPGMVAGSTWGAADLAADVEGPGGTAAPAAGEAAPRPTVGAAGEADAVAAAAGPWEGGP